IETCWSIESVMYQSNISLSSSRLCADICFFFFFNGPATTEIYTLSLHDALPISLEPATLLVEWWENGFPSWNFADQPGVAFKLEDRKSTRLNSSHLGISYAVFCLKKKKKYSQP